jgi:hypothetical protein
VIVHTIKLDEEKSKHAGLAQENGFDVAYLHSLPRSIQSLAKLGTCPKRSVINMI